MWLVDTDNAYGLVFAFNGVNFKVAYVGNAPDGIALYTGGEAIEDGLESGFFGVMLGATVLG